MHMHYLSAKFGGSHPVLRYWHFFSKFKRATAAILNFHDKYVSPWSLSVSWALYQTCSCCTIAENNFVSDVRLMTSYELTSGSVLVIWATPRGRVAYAVPNVVQTSSFNTEILAFTKFNMIAVRHLGFVRGSRATVHEGPLMVAINTSTV